MRVRFMRFDVIREQIAKYSPTTNADDFWVPLTAGRVYVVHAVAFVNSDVHYLVLDDDELPWPMRYCAAAFEFVDSRIPDSWSFGFTPTHADHHALLSFPEWVSDQYFYDRLTKGDPDAVEAFVRSATSQPREQ